MCTAVRILVQAVAVVGRRQWMAMEVSPMAAAHRAEVAVVEAATEWLVRPVLEWLYWLCDKTWAAGK